MTAGHLSAILAIASPHRPGAGSIAAQAMLSHVASLCSGSRTPLSRGPRAW